MTAKNTEFYSYLFQEEEDIIAAYFKTKCGIAYRVYFYPAVLYTDKLHDDAFLVKDGYFFGFSKLPPDEEKAMPFDSKIRNTLLVIIKHFFDEKGTDAILVFHCDDDDKKEAKRAVVFNRWYEMSGASTNFLKYDEEIVIIDDESGQKQKSVYLSLLLYFVNPFKDIIMSEFQLLKEQLISGK